MPRNAPRTATAHAIRPPKKKRRNPLPVLLGIALLLLLAGGVGGISVFAPQSCPNHLCDSLNRHLAPLFGQPVISGSLLTVTVTNPAQPFAAAAGSSTTVATALTVTSAAATPLTWQASADLGWVGFTAASGTIVPGHPGAIGLVLAPDITVQAGSYTATITIASGSSTTTIKITIVVTAAGSP